MPPPGAPGTPGPQRLRRARRRLVRRTVPRPRRSSIPASLNGRQFIAVKVTDDGIVHGLVPGTVIRLTFGDGTVSASAGCNTMSGGAYAIVEDKLILAEGAVTEIGCDPARHAQDDWLFTFLGSKPLVELDGDNLILTSGVTEMALLDQEVAEPDQPLVGPTGRSARSSAATTVSSVPQGVTATIKFNEDGTVEIHPGCNSGSGTYTINESSIDFSDLVTTDMACDGPPMSVEAAVPGGSVGRFDHLLDQFGDPDHHGRRERASVLGELILREVDDLVVLGMSLQVRANERTKRLDAQAAVANVIDGELRQTRADALAFVLRTDNRVHEHDAVRLAGRSCCSRPACRPDEPRTCCAPRCS